MPKSEIGPFCYTFKKKTHRGLFDWLTGSEAEWFLNGHLQAVEKSELGPAQSKSENIKVLEEEASDAAPI